MTTASGTLAPAGRPFGTGAAATAPPPAAPAGAGGTPARAPGRLLGEPDLARVHAPGHGHHRARDPGGAEPQQARDRGVASTGCDGCEHPYSGDAVGWRVMTLFKHKIE